jgi:microcystin-dependent protein
LAALVPAGTVIQSARISAPSGYLLCEGQAVSRSTYSALFDAIGTTYGSGDGSSTFNVPNLQGKVPVGKNSGTFSTLGATGGAETHTLDATQIPSHNHTFSGTTNTTGAHTHDIYGSNGGNAGVSISVTSNTNNDRAWYLAGGLAASAGSHSHTYSGTTSSIGGGQAHNNLQPYIVLNYMIKI